MSLLEKALESGKFGVTAEMAPPKGYDFPKFHTHWRNVRLQHQNSLFYISVLKIVHSNNTLYYH